MSPESMMSSAMTTWRPGMSVLRSFRMRTTRSSSRGAAGGHGHEVHFQR